MFSGIPYTVTNLQGFDELSPELREVLEANFRRLAQSQFTEQLFTDPVVVGGGTAIEETVYEGEHDPHDLIRGCELYYDFHASLGAQHGSDTCTFRTYWDDVLIATMVLSQINSADILTWHVHTTLLSNGSNTMMHVTTSNNKTAVYNFGHASIENTAARIKLTTQFNNAHVQDVARFILGRHQRAYNKFPDWSR